MNGPWNRRMDHARLMFSCSFSRCARVSGNRSTISKAMWLLKDMKPAISRLPGFKAPWYPFEIKTKEHNMTIQAKTFGWSTFVGPFLRWLPNRTIMITINLQWIDTDATRCRYKSSKKNLLIWVCLSIGYPKTPIIGHKAVSRTTIDLRIILNMYIHNII